ncbi:MAG: bifunctional phosphopantothenoylcysteine decarboxylase/phosphopantothenate--cysteine ligase CoaBC [Ignavibacteriae bacterium]|nr:MAG: bifunctional phosphopantothenoylcysteine decarboxylase/phosphopantothenate--cysteine ligase CoaBC [Ignavibacteriota bacterium]
MRGKHVLIGVTGGIAAYKVGTLIRELVKSGAEVKVMMTEAGARFVSPLTFSALSKNPVLTDLWSSNQSSDSDISTQHIDLANWADVLVIAPASANTIAKLACGISDNLLTIVSLATSRPVILAPTMDAEMYLHEVTQKNLATLSERGYFIVPPAEGELASGLKGPGRLPEIKILTDTIENILTHADRDLIKKRILVTAGPTYEAIDPVRFIGNRSSGKMGFAIARAAAQRGAEVTLIAGPVALETPRNVKRIDVESAQEMLSAVLRYSKKTDAVIMAAAVADFTPAHPAKQKIKKQPGVHSLDLPLKATPDILAALGCSKRNTILAGFALETTDGLSGAKEKLRKKNIDLIVLNSFNKQNRVFGSHENTVTIIDKRGDVERLPKLPKFEVANKILDKIRDLL